MVAVISTDPCEPKLDVHAGSGVDELGFRRVDAAQHNGRVAFLSEVDQVSVVTIDVPVLQDNITKHDAAFNNTR